MGYNVKRVFNYTNEYMYNKETVLWHIRLYKMHDLYLLKTCILKTTVDNEPAMSNVSRICV